MSGNKEIGHWDWDENGLPAYEYTGDFPFRAADKTGADSGMPEDPCFILGNSRMTLFAHVSGELELISGQRGWERLNFEGKNRGKTGRKLPSERLEKNRSAFILCRRVRRTVFFGFSSVMGSDMRCTCMKPMKILKSER